MFLPLLLVSSSFLPPSGVRVVCKKREGGRRGAATESASLLSPELAFFSSLKMQSGRTTGYNHLGNDNR